ncbi:MAG TPA: GDSL family lipase, partial [Cyclobacteriaceae bacterium]
SIFSGKDAPAIELQPVNEGTPQFRDIHIKDVVCKGAGTGIFVRGLPEMNIRDVDMENISIQSKKGFVCTEGDNIKLKNVTLYTEESTVMTLQDSKNIVLDNIKYKPSDVLIKVSGNRSKDIRLLNTDGTKAKQEIQLGENVSDKVVIKK